MSGKIENLERTLLELGSEIFRVKHRIDEVERSNSSYKQVFFSLKKLLDDKGIISTEDFDDVVALDVILNNQQSNQHPELLQSLSDNLKKVVN